MTRQPMETAPRDRPILLHVPGFSGDHAWVGGYCRAWTIGHWVVSCGFGSWYSVEQECSLDRGGVDCENIRVEPDGWAPLPEEG